MQARLSEAEDVPVVGISSLAYSRVPRSKRTEALGRLPSLGLAPRVGEWLRALSLT